MNALLKIIEDKKREIESYDDKKKLLESLINQASALQSELGNFDEDSAKTEYNELVGYAIQLGLMNAEAVDDVTESTIVLE